MDIIQLLLSYKEDNAEFHDHKYSDTNIINDAMTDAASNGHIHIVRLLLSLGADDIDEAMCDAVYEGHIEIVQLMLDLGADDLNGAMRQAAYGGHIEIVQLLLDNGANNYQDCIDRTDDDDIRGLLLSYMQR